MSSRLARLGPPAIVLCAMTFAAVQSCEDGSPRAERTEPALTRARPRFAGSGWRWPRITYVSSPVLASLPDAAAPSFDTDASIDPQEPEEPDYGELVARLCAPLAQSLCQAQLASACDPEPDCETYETDGCLSWLRCAYPDPDPEDVIDPRLLAHCLGQARSAHARGLAPPPPWSCAELLVDPATPGQPSREPASACVGGVCVDGLCRRVPERGERCEAECAPGCLCGDRDVCIASPSCSTLADCRAGQVCVDWECRPERGLGQECGSIDECARGLSCTGDRCQPATRCRSDDDCGNGQRCHGHTTDRCVPYDRWPVGGLGEPCPCAAGLACRDAQCVPGLAAGSPCRRYDLDCATGLWCSPATSLCERPVRIAALGEPCDGAPCAGGTTCVSGRCAAEAGLDRECAGVPCARGLFCDAVYDNGTCGPEICVESAWLCDID